MDFGREKKTPWPGDPAGQDTPKMAKMRPKITKMRPKMAKMRPKRRQDAAQDGEDEGQMEPPNGDEAPDDFLPRSSL